MPKEIEFHGNLTKEKFFLEWFGLFGRELGTNKFPHRNWTDNPNDFLEYIKMCASEHEEGHFCRPCWISSQPMRFVTQKGIRLIGMTMGIEKLFFDFDDDTKYCSKCKEYIKKDNLLTRITNYSGRELKGSFCPKCQGECKEQPRKDIVGKEVIKFIEGARAVCKAQKLRFNPEAFVVETRKGYHIYFFLREVWVFKPENFGFAKKIYEKMQDKLIQGKYEFLDTGVKGDIMRFARVPLTPHEKTGKICRVLDVNLKPTKVRSVEFYKMYGIPPSFVKKIIKIVWKEEQARHKKVKEQLKQMKESLGGKTRSSFGIRPCFKKRMDKGEMCHKQRLAWLCEIYHAGYNTEVKMLELCRQTWNDFIEKKSLDQIQDYFKHERYVYPPYKCETIRKKGWCLFEECPLWKRNSSRDKNAY